MVSIFSMASTTRRMRSSNTPRSLHVRIGKTVAAFPSPAGQNLPRRLRLRPRRPLRNYKHPGMGPLLDARGRGQALPNLDASGGGCPLVRPDWLPSGDAIGYKPDKVILAGVEGEATDCGGHHRRHVHRRV